MREARRAVLAAGLLGQVGVVLSGLLPAVLLPVTLVLLAAAVASSERADPARAAVLRRLATGIVLLATALAVPQLTRLGEADSRGVLGPLLVAAQLSQALTWRTRRDLQTGLLVAIGLLVLGASYAPDVLAGLPLLGGWAALVVALVLLQAARVRDAADVVAAGTARPPVLAATALALALGLVAFLLVPVPASGELAGRFRAAAAATSPSSARAQVYAAERVDLRARGSLGDRVLAEVPDDGSRLWRAAAHSTWDGAGWSSPEVVSASLPGPPFAVPGAPAGTRRSHRVELRGGRGTVWSPGLAASVDAGTWGALDSAGALRLPATVSSYVVDSVPLEDDPEVLRAAAPGPPDARWLQLPAALPDRVRRLAEQITADSPTTYDKVLAVERWLAGSASYRLDSPVPGPGEDAVDRFLFVDRVGFCEQFAAAETVLLRAVGIPARFVVGLAYGEPLGNGRRVFRENMLHAWVEVSYDGVGWAPSDPTAGAAQAAVAPSLRGRLAQELAAGLRSLDGLPGGRPALAGALVLLLLGTAAVRRREPTRAPTAPAGPADRAAATDVGGRPALAAFLRWDASLGPARRREAESLAELRDRLRLPPEPAEAVGVVEQECYAAVPPSKDAVAASVRVLAVPAQPSAGSRLPK